MRALPPRTTTLITSNTFLGTLQNGGRRKPGAKIGWGKCVIFVFFVQKKSILVASQNCFTDVFTTFLDLGTFQLLSVEGHIALRFHQKHLNLCSGDERRSYGFVTTWGWVINDIIFILGWTISLKTTAVLWFQLFVKWGQKKDVCLIICCLFVNNIYIFLYI